VLVIISAMARLLSAISFAVAALAVSPASAVTYYTGDGTTYGLGSIGSGNCNFMSSLSTASTNYVAMNQAQWDSLGVCGRCVEVSCVDSKCTSTKNIKRTLQVLDRCPECSSGDLDMPPAIFKDLTGSTPSRYKIQWRFVDCPSPGTIKVCLKEGSNPWWVAIQPTNFITGVKSVTINNKNTAMLDGAYYYVLTSTSEINLSSVSVAITSIYGDVVQGTFALTVGKCTDTKKQFTIHTSRRMLEGNATAVEDNDTEFQED
jgi:expansin (peptidoglycan-binding protein)